MWAQSGPVLGPVLGVQFPRRPVTQSSSRLSQQFRFVVFEFVTLKASSTDVLNQSRLVHR